MHPHRCNGLATKVNSSMSIVPMGPFNGIMMRKQHMPVFIAGDILVIFLFFAEISLDWGVPTLLKYTLVHCAS